MRILRTLLIGAGLAVAVAIGFAASGIYDVSASSPHTGPMAWLLSMASHASIERRSRDVIVPDLGDPALIRAGVNDFDAMCVGCHGAPGRKPAAIGQGLNPAPPDLARSAEHMSPGELFWVTKHGVKMTGMPAWGATHDDNTLWPVVAFITRLPELDADGYQALLASSAGSGHHAGDNHSADHDHGDSAASDRSDAAHEHETDDLHH